MPTHSTLLIGRYLFTRTIDDWRTGRQHRASGRLELTRTAWREWGVLHTAGDLPFYQRYALSFCGTGLRVERPGRGVLFQLDELEVGAARIRYRCGADLYLGVWRFENRRLHLDWCVKGPRKGYTMRTGYRKLDPPKT